MAKNLRIGLASVAIVLSGCAANPHSPRPQLKTQPKYDYIQQGDLTQIKLPAPLPEPLKSCAELSLAEVPSTREIHVQALGFDEIYIRHRIQAVLTESLDFSTTIPAMDGQPRQRIFVRVPAGFVTDFSSIPRGLSQSIHRTFGKTTVTAIAHDFLYAIGRHGDAAERRLADIAMNEGMTDSGSNSLSRVTVYLPIRLGGHKNYGTPTELRFLDANRGRDETRIVIPIKEFKYDANNQSLGAVALREKYVRMCPLV